jgi:hypothetical protein
VRKHINPGTMLGVIAVVFAMTGSAFAANSLLTSKDIKDGTIKSRDLSGAVKDKLNKVGKTGPAGKNGTNGATGPQGAAGAKGADGAKGAPGADGQDAAYSVRALSNDQDVAAPGWVTRKGLANATDAVIDADGVKFGPFADGDAFAGVISHALDGLKLSDIDHIAYSAKYTGGGSSGGGAPYFRILTSGHSYMFSPLGAVSLGGASPKPDTWQRWVVTKGGVTRDDDGGNPTKTWTGIVTDHGNEIVQSVSVQAGWAGSGSNGSTSHVRAVTMEANGAAGVYADYIFGL